MKISRRPIKFHLKQMITTLDQCRQIGLSTRATRTCVPQSGNRRF